MLNLFDGRIKSSNKNKSQKLRNCLKFAYVLIKLRLFDGLRDVTTIQSTTWAMRKTLYFTHNIKQESAEIK